MKRKPLYIETKIKGDLDTLWTYTQDPELHEQWDLRFTEIKYLPKEKTTERQHFLYTTKIGFGIKVNGIGESVATKTKDNGENTSVLKFSSKSKTSIIKEGSGYWKYIPETNGIKFLTGYDYETRWGIFGKVIDKLIFRPLMIWATAWSFDCLKNWIEKEINPKQAIMSQWTVVISHLIIGLIWIYHGLVPKLLYPDTGELEMIQRSGLFQGLEEKIVTITGSLEIIFGLTCILIHKKGVHVISIVALTLLFVGALVSKPTVFTFPFNPFSLTISMITISVIALFNYKYLPKASNCITKQKA